MRWQHMKKFLIAVVLLLGGIIHCSAQSHSLAEAYDFYKPNGPVQRCFISVSGDLPRGRVSMYPAPKVPELAPEKNGIKSVYARLINIGSEDGRAFSMWTSAPISMNEWTRITVSFVPRMNGKVRFGIRPEHATFVPGFIYPTLRFICVANLTAQNTKFQDTFFDKRLNKTWNVVPFGNKLWEEKLKPEQFKNVPDAPGKKYVKTCRDLTQEISVKKEKPVVVTFYVKADYEYLSKIPGERAQQ